MSLRNYTRLVVGSLLGMILPRSGAATDAPASDDAAIARAAELEAANKRILELEGINEVKIREEAERLVHDIFPQNQLPDETPRYTRPADDGGAPADPPSLEEQVAQINARLSDREIEDASRELQARIDQAVESKFPRADKWRVIAQIAAAGNAPINIEKLLEISHNSRTAELEGYYSERRAAEAAATRGAIPPPIPTNPGGVPVVGEKPTLKTATAMLIAGMKEKMGWGAPR
jgi:hypothetical protein